MATRKPKPHTARPAAKNASWTILVYLAGDNNLDAAGSVDLAEMKKVGSSAEVNIVAQFDRAGARGTTKRYYLRKATTLASDIVEDLGETNMGDPAVLRGFLQWGVKRYPAQHYMAVLWNHGSGMDDSNLYAPGGDYFGGDPPPVIRKRTRMLAKPTARARKRGEPKRAVSFAQAKSAFRRADRALFDTAVKKMVRYRAIAFDDEAKDFIDNIELKRVLAEVRKTLGRPLDIVGFDACLMSMLEVEAQIQETALYSVGSQEEEPGDGWPYDRILKQLAAKPATAPEKLARLVVQEYAASYRAGDGVTLSAVDLAATDKVSHAVDALAKVLVKHLRDGAAANLIGTVRAKVQEYSAPYDDYVDLVDLCNGLRHVVADAALSHACSEVKTAVAAMVLASEFRGEAVERSNGLSIYFPKKKVSKLYATLDFGKQNAWAEFIDRYTKDVGRRGWR
jgi:hypothetical protein